MTRRRKAALVVGGVLALGAGIVWLTGVGWILIVLLQLAALLGVVVFIARVLGCAVSPEVADSVRRQPWLHVLWAVLAAAVLAQLAPAGALTPNWVRQIQQRREILQRVESAGGWDAIRVASTALVSNYLSSGDLARSTNRNMIYMIWRSGSSSFTNFTSGPIPVVLQRLKPIQFWLDQPLTNSTTTVVHLSIMTNQRSGPGLPKPYLALEVPVGPEASTYRPWSPSLIKPLAEGVYEVY